MDKKLNELMEDLDKVLGLIKKISEATPEDVDSIKRDINLTRKELKERYGKENTPETNSQEA
jgi:Asp-tRNA(Asn)/Glu-tRNA(Gln) amidotransferase C subunit